MCGAERISRGGRELGGGSVGRPSGVGVADDDGGGTWECSCMRAMYGDCCRGIFV